MPDTKRLEAENQKLQLAINELSILNDIATAISSTQPVEKVINQIILKCIRHLHVEEAAISLLDQIEENQTFHTMIRRQDHTHQRVPFKLDDRVTGWMIKNQKPLLINNTHDDDLFRFFKKEELSYKAILCVPLMIKGKLTGYLAVFNKKNYEKFTAEDKKLFKKILARLREEMRLAYKIQLNLLPKTLPQIEGFEFVATSIPAEEVGGDYYDFIQLENGKLGFCVGDVTGKGMPAAMLMANLQATLRSQVITGNYCADCLNKVNKLLFRSTEPTKFATLFYGILDPLTGSITYVNGGHDGPILLKKGHPPVMLDATGLLLGVMENVVYKQSKVVLDPGDILMLYSDGITESMNLKMEELGLKALLSTLEKFQNDSADNIRDKVKERIKQHAGNVPQSDDITMMIIKKT
jgi:sigma-B regulation protein RsbU (phosphoserine phosphatase)